MYFVFKKRALIVLLKVICVESIIDGEQRPMPSTPAPMKEMKIFERILTGSDVPVIFELLNSSH